MINWKVRIQQKSFWITLIPAMIILIQAVANVFGIQLDLSVIGDKLGAVVEAVFMVLAILGIANDFTTKGFMKDSENALTYEEPK